MRKGRAHISSSIEMMARSLTASDKMVTPNIVMKPSTVEGMVNRFVVKVPNLVRVSAPYSHYSCLRAYPRLRRERVRYVPGGLIGIPNMRPLIIQISMSARSPSKRDLQDV